MLFVLSARENGSQAPFLLERAESTRRAHCLELSKQRDFTKKHKRGINSLHLEAIEYRYLLSGGSDGFVSLYDLHNMERSPKCNHSSLFTIDNTNKDCHRYSVETVQWYPLDSGMFTSSGMDKMLKVWDTNALVAVDTYTMSDVIYSHEFSPVATKHSLIAVASRSTKVKLVDLKSGSATHSLKGHKLPVITVRWSTKNEYLLASGGEDGRVLLWDIRRSKSNLVILDQHNGDSVASPNSVNVAHNGIVNGMKFTADGLKLVTCGTDCRMRLWDTSTGRNLLTNYGKVLNESNRTIKLTITENCQPNLVYMPEDSNIRVLSMLDGETVGMLRGHYNLVNCCEYHPLYHELYSSGNDRNILIWTADSETDSAYKESLRTTVNTQNKTRSGYVRKIVLQDNWSSDED